MCAVCHSTQVDKGYDAPSGSFNTTSSEISVGCESCHGPGSAHEAWARNKAAGPIDPGKGLTVALDERRGVSWIADAPSGNAKRSAQRSSEREIEVCDQCMRGVRRSWAATSRASPFSTTTCPPC